jgi:hypothetical protein
MWYLIPHRGIERNSGHGRPLTVENAFYFKNDIILIKTAPETAIITKALKKYFWVIRPIPHQA